MGARVTTHDGEAAIVYDCPCLHCTEQAWQLQLGNTQLSIGQWRRHTWPEFYGELR